MVDAIQQMVANLGGSAPLRDIVDALPRAGLLPQTPTPENTVRTRIQEHSSDAAAFKIRNPDLFYSVEGIGRGVWGLRPGVAAKFGLTADADRNPALTAAHLVADAAD